MDSAQAVPSEKTCSKCGEVHSLSNFYKNQAYCKPCHKAYYKQWNAANKEKRHEYHTKRRYGISAEEYKSKFEEQGGKCAICKCSQVGKQLAVDHCHRTGKVRSLLCDNCNKAIGLFKENIETIESALNYVKLHQSCFP